MIIGGGLQKLWAWIWASFPTSVRGMTARWWTGLSSSWSPIVFAGDGSAGIEKTVLVTEEGHEVLTRSGEEICQV